MDAPFCSKEEFLRQVFVDYLERIGYEHAYHLHFGHTSIIKWVSIHNGREEMWYQDCPDIADPKFDPEIWACRLFNSIDDESQWKINKSSWVRVHPPKPVEFIELTFKVEKI